MAIKDWILGRQPTELKLYDDTSYGNAKIGMPRPPPLDVSVEGLSRYAKKSELVYACIEKKAQAACDAVLTVEKRVGTEYEPLQSHPLTNLLNKPNPWNNGESFMRSWVASENISDNFYCEIVRSGAGVPVGLYPLNPIYLVPQWVMRTHSWAIDFYYYFQTGYPVRLEVKDLLVRRRHSVGSLFSDTSALTIALGSVDADAAATDYVRAFYNNGGAPSGILLNKGRRLTDDEAKAKQQQWIQRYGRGGTNRAGIAVLDAEAAEFITVGSKLSELNSDSLDEKTETRICMAFGVPPIIIGARVGLKHVTQNATAKAAMGEFWQHTMSPELKSMRNWLTWDLLPMFEPIEAIKRGDIRCNWDMSQVVALQEDIDGVHSRVGTGYQNGIYMLNEARAAVGLDAVTPEQGGDQFYKPPAPVHIQGQDPNQSPPKQPKNDAGKALLASADPKQLRAFLQAEHEFCSKVDLNVPLPERFAAFQEGEGPFKDILDAQTLEKKTFDFNGLTLGREPTPLEMTIDLKGMVAEFESAREKMAKVLISIRGELIKQTEGAIGKIKPVDVHELVLTPPDKAYSRVQKVVDALFTTGQRQVASDLAAQKLAAGKGEFFPADRYETKDLTDDWKKFLAKIVDRTVSRVINEIQTRAINFFVSRGLLDESDDQIIKDLRAALEDQSLKAFENMAQEAANASIGAGRSSELEARADEIEMYEYSAILDKNTCDPCDSADGQQAKDIADLPEAPNPDCEGGANCRCFIVGIGAEANP